MIGFIDKQTDWYNKQTERYKRFEMEAFPDRLRVKLTLIDRVSEAFRKLGEAFRAMARIY